MCHDSKSLYFKFSPYVVVYAELLLCLQYIFGLSLTQTELPDETPAIIRQLGFEKPRKNPPFYDLVLKSLFTFIFWLTLRQKYAMAAGMVESTTKTMETEVESGRRVENPQIVIENEDGGAINPTGKYWYAYDRL